jgi:hypothetical protein
MEIAAISSGPKAPRKMTGAVDKVASSQLELQHRPKRPFAFHCLSERQYDLRGRVVRPQAVSG